jgi:aspartokinase-like uncharacterized kinase
MRGPRVTKTSFRRPEFVTATHFDKRSYNPLPAPTAVRGIAPCRPLRGQGAGFERVLDFTRPQRVNGGSRRTRGRTLSGFMALVVLKLGGSLFELPHLSRLIRAVIAQRPTSNILLVVGGGPAADVVRNWDETFHLSPEDAHWLAIEAMQLNESLIARLLPELRIVRSARQVTAAMDDGVPALLCASCFLRWGEAAGHEPLPRSWQVTSDSIAAWTAQVLSAEELVLMKSIPLPKGMSAKEAAIAGLVDPHFPHVVSGMARLSWVDGRTDAGTGTIVPWSGSPS